ncbi:uncharacterized protein TNCT_683451 [Trichonephila clavata]|uniref:Methyltransferase type 11 domain-containing protein n=1 Tax=Trichonephila clavata TaxID=2740835 RepID=A0A8X6HPG9_TRICU|nr:uncharacterized protein TNCT_683451 [Trichonephila clavata]
MAKKMASAAEEAVAAVASPPLCASTDAKRFLELISSKFGWGDLSDDIVMDIGCGNPKIKFCDLLLGLFPKVKKVIAIDKKSHLIAYIKCGKKNPKIDFEYGDIEDRSTLENWEGKISKVVSSHCFHQLKDHETAFKNVYLLLKPGGEAALLFCLQSGYVGWHVDLVNDPKWKKYYNGNSPEIPLTQFSNPASSFYKNLAEEIGFKIVFCEKDRIGVPFESDESWKGAIFNLALSSFKIPDELKEEFKEYLYETFMKYNCRTDSDRPCQISYFLTALLRKPEDSTE